MSKSNLIRIIVAYDYPVIRLGLAAIIEHESDMTIVGQARNEWEAKELFCQKQPDVVLMNLRLLKLSGVRKIQNILTKFDSQNMIMILANYDNESDIYSGIKASAQGYLLENSEPEEIISAIRSVTSKKSYISPIVTTKVKEWMKKPRLSTRELEVLQLITNGNNNQKIAATLFVTEGTVKYHVNKILAKLGVNDRTQAVLTGIKYGIVSF